MMSSTASDNIQEVIQQLLQKHNVSFENGLTSDEVRSRREDVGYYNTVAPPIQCPAWICCLLPCIRHIPSMKLYQQILPEDTEVRRNNGKYVRYDATTLVCGDIIRIADGDIIPADCIVLHLETEELLIDHRYITGDDKPVSIVKNKDGITSNSAVIFNVNAITTLYWGGRVVLGSGIAICTAVGPNTYVSKLIRSKRFPPSNILSSSSTNEAHIEEMVQFNGDIDIELNRIGDEENHAAGVALLRQNSRDGSTRAV
jgi:magnesium-transporting ATPase (P-type)